MTRPPGASAVMLPSQTSALARDRPPPSTSTSLQVRTAALSLRQALALVGIMACCCALPGCCCTLSQGHQLFGVCDLL
jgi:hypothetical protein